MTPDKPSASEARELLSCPFCGKKPKKQNGDRNKTHPYSAIYCANDKCFGPATTAAEFEDALIQWNTRASPAPQGGERDTKSAPGAECSLPSGESGPPVTSGFPGADTAELRLLIEEYRPSNHDWGFRKSVILDVLSRIESRSGGVITSVEVIFGGDGAARDRIDGKDLCRSCYGDLVSAIRTLTSPIPSPDGRGET